MKKWLSLLFLLSFPALAKADIIKSSLEEPVLVRLSTQSIVTSTNIILVDLSSTTVYPHKNTGFLNVVGIRLDVAKVAASSGTIKLGVVYRIDQSSGDVKWFYSYDFSKSAAGTEIIDRPKEDFFFYRLKVGSDNSTPYLLTNDKTEFSTNFQNDVALLTPTGSYVNTDKGDIILSFTNSGSNAMNLTIDLLYNSER